MPAVFMPANDISPALDQKDCSCSQFQLPVRRNSGGHRGQAANEKLSSLPCAAAAIEKGDCNAMIRIFIS